ncbi:sigma-70 family RNA polymerase sigma factor [Spirosoma sp. HMF4905]|uniref:Sigma-70 family RNA polymerase sigma factor n=1 Tax=Spirosoma arboris TaxID=2682092 RepID=A0A7K1SE65_9BACT|nr:sigma-70 family RNA polymerase sigma factor [Spirosoma arboris]MVM32095.1 sigma-70 family RNA polymerase sigma factor [Spirosoma arboris]
MIETATLTDYPSDQQLWQRFREGDQVAFEQIIASNYNSLFRFGTRFTKDVGLIEDCLHDLFVYLWEKRQSLGATDSIRKYLFKSFRHKMLLELQRVYRRGWVSEDEAAGMATEQNFQDVLFRLEKEQLTTHKVKEAINQLPVRQQEALYLRYFEGLDVDHIAQIMNINRQSVSNHLHKALTYLRENWQDFTISMLFFCFF